MVDGWCTVKQHDGGARSSTNDKNLLLKPDGKLHNKFLMLNALTAAQRMRCALQHAIRVAKWYGRTDRILEGLLGHCFFVEAELGETVTSRHEVVVVEHLEEWLDACALCDQLLGHGLGHL